MHERIEKGAQWVGKAFAADSKLAADLRAYMQYALAVAGKPMRARWRQVFEQRTKLSPYGLAMLGLALELVKDARAGEVAAALEQRRAAGQRAGVVDRHARPDAGFLRRRDARSHRLRRQVPVASAPEQPAAAEGRAVADEPSQRGLLVEHPPSRPPW